MNSLRIVVGICLFLLKIMLRMNEENNLMIDYFIREGVPNKWTVVK
jgi:hypothetical protein